jgi:hypothetical protein
MNNIDQMKSLIDQLEALGQAEVAEQIQSLKQKVAELEAKAIAEAQALKVKTSEEAKVIETETIGFFTKYRTELIITAVLIIIHAVSKFGY